MLWLLLLLLLLQYWLLAAYSICCVMSSLHLSFGAANLFSRFFPEFSDASFLRNCYWLRDIPLANQFIYCSSYFTDWLDILAKTVNLVCFSFDYVCVFLEMRGLVLLSIMFCGLRGAFAGKWSIIKHIINVEVWLRCIQSRYKQAGVPH